MSDEQEIQAAEQQMDEADIDLDAARLAHRSAKGRLRGAVRLWRKRITGPIEPVGARVVRRSAPLSELPAYLWHDELRWPRGIAVDRPYAANGHVLIAVDSIEGLTAIDVRHADVTGSRAEPLTRDDAPIKLSKTLTIRSFSSARGRVLANARYTTIVEDLFPGAEWYAAHFSTGGERHLHAVVEGHLVAVVMPLHHDILDTVST